MNKLQQSKQKPPLAPPKTQAFYRHRALAIVLGIVFLIMALVCGVKYYYWSHRLSDKDFAAIAAAGKHTLNAVGAQQIHSDNNCVYEAPGEFQSNRLYCNIKMAGYIPYTSDSNTTAIARTLEREVQSNFGPHFYGLADFYKAPHNNTGTTTAQLRSPLPNIQCNFDISSNDKAKDAVDFLPKRSEDNLIAVQLYCSGEARGEYFPVTYRQGQ